MLSFAMNARSASSNPFFRASVGTAPPAKQPTEMSIGRFLTSQATIIEKSKTNVVDDRKLPYKDYSHVAPPKTSKASLPTSSWKAMGKEPSFPVRLHKILSSPHFSHVISFLPNGRAWKILDQKVFEEQVIPLFFKTGKYASFCRQVNGWGFRRITRGKDAGAYYHEMFLRGMPHLAEKMKRVKNAKDDKRKAPLSGERTPDFDAISRAKPLPKDSTPSQSKKGSRNLDAFLSSLTDEEAHFLARRRAQMLERAANIASAQREMPTLPTDRTEMDAFLSTLSDEDALVLARRREQELLVLQAKLRQLRSQQASLERQRQQQRQQQASRASSFPAVAAQGATRVSFHNELDLNSSTTTLTGEEKLLLATHRARKLAAGHAKQQQSAIEHERALWEQLKKDLLIPAPQAPAPPPSLAAKQKQALETDPIHRNPLLAALMARPISDNTNAEGRQWSNSQSNSNAATQENPLVAALMARRANNVRAPAPPAISHQPKREVTIRQKSPPNVDSTSIQERARMVKVQADFLQSAIEHDARRASMESASTLVSENSQRQSEMVDPTTPQGRRKSLDIVKAALDTMRRASVDTTSSAGSTQRLQNQPQQRDEISTPAHGFASRPTEMEGLSQHTAPSMNESRANMERIRESLLGSSDATSVLDVAKFLVMNKKEGGRSS